MVTLVVVAETSVVVVVMNGSKYVPLRGCMRKGEKKSRDVKKTGGL